MTFYLDRFEGDKAVLIYENQTVIVSKSDLPKGTKEGDLLDVRLTVNKKATKVSKKRVKKLLSELLTERR